MRGKFKGMLMALALVAGMSALATTASAQTTRRTRDGGYVTVYPNGRRVYHRSNGRTVRRSPNGRSVVILPNGRRVVRSSRSRQSYPQTWGNRRGRTFRTPGGRLVTVYPNGRRVYH